MIIHYDVDSVECFDCKCTECEHEFDLPCRLVEGKLKFCPVCGEKVTVIEGVD